MSQLNEYFLGASPLLRNLDVIHYPDINALSLNKFGLSTESSGEIRILVLIYNH